MIQTDSKLQKYESMTIDELKKEIYAVRKNITNLNKGINNIKRYSKSQFSFLLYPPPKSEPSILKQTTEIEILDSSPNIPSNESKGGHLLYDPTEKKKSTVNPEIIKHKLQENMNMDLNSMIENHNNEVNNIQFGSVDEASISEYFPKQTP